MHHVRGAIWVVGLVVAVGAIGLYHHARGARFVGSVVPINFSLSECEGALTPSGYSERAAESICTNGERGLWAKASVTNVGHRGASLSGCFVRVLDSSNHELFNDYLGVGAVGFPAGPYLDPGETFRWSWFMNSRQARAQALSPTPVHYEATCPPIQYGRTPV